MRELVIDANLMIKLLNEEPDSEMAFEFFEYCHQNRVLFIAPELFEYEVIAVLTKAKVPLFEILSLLKVYENDCLLLQKPTLDDWQFASKICQDGNEKSGYPSMYDSIYQAMAINRNIQFITADSRHFAKASKHGNIALLENWQSLFDEN